MSKLNKTKKNKKTTIDVQTLERIMIKRIMIKYKNMNDSVKKILTRRLHRLNKSTRKYKGGMNVAKSVQDASKMLCEYGIDLDVLLYNVYNSSKNNGIHLDVVLTKLSKYISLPISLPSAETIKEIFTNLKTETAPNCPLLDRTDEPVVQTS